MWGPGRRGFGKLTGGRQQGEQSRSVMHNPWQSGVQGGQKLWYCTCFVFLARRVVLLRLYGVPVTGKNVPVGMSCLSTGVRYDLQQQVCASDRLTPRFTPPLPSLPVPASSPSYPPPIYFTPSASPHNQPPPPRPSLSFTSSVCVKVPSKTQAEAAAA